MTTVKYEYTQPIGVTSEARTLSVNFSNAMDSYVGKSIAIAQQKEEAEFNFFVKLKNQWKEETMFISSGTEIISNSAYEKIISLGEGVLPWIINELKQSDDHWFFALEKITGINPVKRENIGYTNKMREDWIAWADNK